MSLLLKSSNLFPQVKLYPSHGDLKLDVHHIIIVVASERDSIPRLGMASSLTQRPKRREAMDPKITINDALWKLGSITL